MFPNCNDKYGTVLLVRSLPLIIYVNFSTDCTVFYTNFKSKFLGTERKGPLRPVIPKQNPVVELLSLLSEMSSETYTGPESLLGYRGSESNR